MTRVGVLALQGGVAEHERAMAACGYTTVKVRSPELISGLDGLIIPGGESTTISMLCQRWGLFPALEEAVAGGLPMFGSCAGMIMLASDIADGRSDQRSLGAIDMHVRRNAFGRQVDSFEANVSIPIIGPAPFPAVFIRAPWVESIGPAVTVLASLPSSEGSERIIAVAHDRTIATAFHPELTDDYRLHQLFGDLITGTRTVGDTTE